jgi:hypothetical protein
MGFGMFTEEGEKRVANIVKIAKDNGWSWARTEQELYMLADSDAQLFGEATDTVVRENVYVALGY